MFDVINELFLGIDNYEIFLLIYYWYIWMWFIWYLIVLGLMEFNDFYFGVDIFLIYVNLLRFWCGYLLDGF